MCDRVSQRGFFWVNLWFLSATILQIICTSNVIISNWCRWFYCIFSVGLLSWCCFNTINSCNKLLLVNIIKINKFRTSWSNSRRRFKVSLSFLIFVFPLLTTKEAKLLTMKCKFKNEHLIQVLTKYSRTKSTIIRMTATMAQTIGIQIGNDPVLRSAGAKTWYGG